MDKIEDKLNFIENYLEKYFDNWLIKDIGMIQDKELRFTLPYILMVSAGIDFLGGLADGFKRNNSSTRSNNFIKVWMVKGNPLYKVDGMSEVIYDYVRCGSIHQAIYKKGVESSSEIYLTDKHLHLRIRSEGEDRIFIHAWQFACDFINAQIRFREEHISQNIDTVYDNLNGMLKNEKNYDNLKVIPKKEDIQIKYYILIKYLKDHKFTFTNENECFRSPSAPPDE